MFNRLCCILFIIFLAAPVTAADQPVVLNVNTHIYHHPSCKWAQKCTKSCIKTTKEQAKSSARPCKICGG